MDAETLYQQGVAALKERKDKEQGRKLLMQSLKLDPNNDMAWLWLTRAVDDPDKRLQCLDRALSINPDNAQALELKKRLAGQDGNSTSAPVKRKTSTMEAAKVSTAEMARKPALSASNQAKLDNFLKKGDDLLAKGDAEGAVTQWVYALEIQPDHDVALRNSIQQLAKLGYMDDVKELVNRAIDAGTTSPSIYLTAIDIARREDQYRRADDLRDMVVRLPTADDKLITMIVDDYLKVGEEGKAEHVLEQALEAHPKSQKLLIRMGDLKKKSGWKREAMVFYDRAAKLGLSSKEGREADKALSDYAPVVTDRERGSILLAWREAFGFGAVYLLMGWTDAGLDLLNMGARWAGIPLAIVGGYLLVTATSSPQQRFLGKLLLGKVPEIKQEVGGDLDDGIVHEKTELPSIPIPFRAIFGAVGLAILVCAFTIVFSTAIFRYNNPTRPADIMSLCEVVWIIDTESEMGGFLAQLMACGG
jgi:tetratricopeptide (TPR) repeat protein